MDNPRPLDGRRLITFVALTVLIWSVMNLFFAPSPEAPPPEPAPAAAAPAARRPATAQAAFTPRTVEVRSPLYRYQFSTRGGALTGAELLGHASYVQQGQNVQLVPQGATDVLTWRVPVAPGDTVDLRGVEFRPSAPGLALREGGGPDSLVFTADAGGGVGARVVYTFRPDDYVVDVRGQLTGVPAGAPLVTELGPGLAPHDAPEHGTDRELAAVAWDANRVENLPLRSVEEPDTLGSALRWAGIKDRYFLLALIPRDTVLAAAYVRDLPDFAYRADDEERVSPRAAVTAVLPLRDGGFAMQAYLGTLEHGRLVAVGHELEEVNPYGYRWLRPVVRPIAQVVLWMLREMHDGLGISYGWVLVLFGFIVRAVTWPLNSKAGRAQMKNMAMQPELQRRMEEIRTRHANDQKAQYEAMQEMYKELGVSPFSMLSGCFPLLIPWPVLITLFFVFQGAIEFRGASFGYLPDLSLKDPYFVLPIFLALSMFAVQWVTTQMSGMEQNEQMKIMMYMMPLMMGFFFWWMPSGLNLYYASTNVASIPQTLLLARERRRAMEAFKAEQEAKARALRPTPAPGGRKGKKKG